ncbi:NAD(+) diphosphatase [Aestuariirhabdus litorea]|uniref:NAD(+) diphosphatase n=1 Tax=Aestuariirhabdus litorea TaxID=2528527 RepID=A0A3P3VMP0_9GAMM|nr:NAD(+) diphosphatase [Aestuariirhabdus litorea]RRJ84031.1 NAD(+) diphosphatase [Aestuariirhabdus litorea]RWW97251.1 NAD(+) diphosphatase [Endozoicomonadaceae bacterium GTF-13]
MSYRSLQYTGERLDRADHRRSDADWLASRRGHPATRLVVLWRNQHLFDEAPTPTPRLLQGALAAELMAQGEALTFLGEAGGEALFTVDLSALEAEELLARVDGGRLLDLRLVGPLLERELAAQLAYARGILYWHRQHRFCGRCGAPTLSVRGGHVRRCSDAGCGRESYPRTDPAVIMLVELPAAGGQPARCLLGRQRSWPAGVFSTLAGFVEPGESLEVAVAREVAEEASVPVTDVRYQASQPWPFPSSLMLGFRARALSEEIRVDGIELEQAHWFTADQLRAAGEWNSEGEGLKLPRRDSISRALVEAWIAEQP